MHISWYLNISKHFIIQCGATVIVDMYYAALEEKAEALAG